MKQKTTTIKFSEQERAMVLGARTAIEMEVRIALRQSLRDNPVDLWPIHPDQSRWFAQGFLRADAEEFVTVVLRNGKEFGIHFLQDYLDDSARLQIVECVRSAPQEFRDHLAYLFYLRDVMEHSVVSEPWSKAQEKAREAPARHYLPKVVVGWGVMDEDMDERRRGRKLRAVIDVLTHYLPVQKHWFWQTALRHIADHGDGKAPQRHAGAERLNGDDLKKTLDAIEGRTYGQAATKTKKTRRGLLKQLATFEKRGEKVPRKK